jgi:hypothetical protein
MPATLQEIVTASTQLIGEVAGVGVQQYSEDILFDHAVRAFDLLFKRYPWSQFRDWSTVTLNGTTGIITTDAFEQVRDFEDVLSVHRAGETDPLPVLSVGTNPNTLGTGTRPLAWTSLRSTHANYTARKIKIYPVSATGDLDVNARYYPVVPPALEWDWEDTMHLDKSLLVYATSFVALVSNAVNPDAANTCKTLMQVQLDAITGSLANHPIALEGTSSIPDTWGVRP